MKRKFTEYRAENRLMSAFERIPNLTGVIIGVTSSHFLTVTNDNKDWCIAGKLFWYGICVAPVVALAAISGAGILALADAVVAGTIIIGNIPVQQIMLAAGIAKGLVQWAIDKVEDCLDDLDDALDTCVQEHEDCINECHDQGGGQ